MASILALLSNLAISFFFTFFDLDFYGILDDRKKRGERSNFTATIVRMGKLVVWLVVWLVGWLVCWLFGWWVGEADPKPRRALNLYTKGIYLAIHSTLPFRGGISTQEKGGGKPPPWGPRFRKDQVFGRFNGLEKKDQAS